MSTVSSTPDTSVFNKDRHVKYWLRCLKSFLPTGYTSNDSNRMTLALFTLSALDLLGVLHEETTADERRDWIEWIYLCQHPEGGFRGFTGTDFGDELRNEENQHWDPANLAGTFFALAALAVLGDDFGRVRRRQCLEWLKKLQWEDGSFGEVLGEGGRIEGKRDVRYSFLAALVRWILRGEKGDVDGSVGDIDVDALAGFITASQTYEGGIAKAPFHEAHAGWTYCGVGALSLLNRLPSIHRLEATPEAVDPSFVEDILHWLVMRQTSMLSEDDDANDDGNGDEEAGTSEGHAQEHEGLAARHSSLLAAHTEHKSSHSMGSTTNEANIEDLHWAGFNGRCNKVADTCYSFWVGGSLGILKNVHLLDFNANRRYLLEKTQHIIGGFGKLPGDPPDILHSYLGLAALAVMKEPGLKSLDPTLCISVSAREHLESLPWRRKPPAFQGVDGIEQKMGIMSIYGG